MAHKYSLIGMALRGSRLRREHEEQASEPSPPIPQRTPVTTYPCRDCPDKRRSCEIVGCAKYGEYMDYIEAQKESAPIPMGAA